MGMVSYIIQRVVYIIVVFFLCSVLLFWIYSNVPGSRVLMFMEGGGMDPGMTPEQFAILYQQTLERLGLDRPPHIQYFRWITGLLSGDFGYSTLHRMPVRNALYRPLINTVRLNLVVMFFVFIITIPLGIRSAVKKNKIFDNVVQVVTVLGISIPMFVLAILAIVLFVIVIPGDFFPITGWRSVHFQGTWWEEVRDIARHMILPVIVLVFSSLAALTRFTRAAMIEALSMDCIRTARAKGLKEKVVIYSHALRNAQITVIIVMAGWFIGVFSGSAMVERVFGFRGMGDELIRAIVQRDFALAQAMNMFFIIVSLVGLLIIDILFVIADPRIKLNR